MRTKTTAAAGIRMTGHKISELSSTTVAIPHTNCLITYGTMTRQNSTAAYTLTTIQERRLMTKKRKRKKTNTHTK